MISLQDNRYKDIHKRGSFASARNGGHTIHVLDSCACTSIEFPCREDTTQRGRPIWACDVAHAYAAARSIRHRGLPLCVVAEQQVPDEDSPASPCSGTPPERLACADTWLSSATDD